MSQLVLYFEISSYSYILARAAVDYISVSCLLGGSGIAGMYTVGWIKIDYRQVFSFATPQSPAFKYVNVEIVK